MIDSLSASLVNSEEIAFTLMTAMIKWVVLLAELIGVIIVVYAIFKAVHGFISKDSRMRLVFAQDLELAITFKLAGELLRTIIVHTWDEILIVGAIILLRGLLTLLIRWDIKMEKRDLIEQRVFSGSAEDMEKSREVISSLISKKNK